MKRYAPYYEMQEVSNGGWISIYHWQDLLKTLSRKLGLSVSEMEELVAIPDPGNPPEPEKGSQELSGRVCGTCKHCLEHGGGLICNLATTDVTVFRDRLACDKWERA